ncbi:MAG: type I restriction enzyme HsdR N-terminal domain-containing protein [Roseburia sp.]|uniref:type I restriction enzyme HsdR N-terminal domain-containing protein n=1 Tax=Roseburia hominis TaxID=301301 RepID=UPI001F386461|nr:type I restriction enzyme HsdR N-terminal domain-containing protein [Roseburia hominis]MCI5712277.1 type I restriction enzyme HsdR N-terminal domain-containing protein [Lachnospiraceae bacterium]MDY4839976.1 type I restriction enzyme HsdR N-terminal domain-containing protein [Lachnospiraceae bacterium]
MEEIIKQLRKEFNRIGDNRQESNIRLHIIENTFMNYYGYDLSKCIEEKSVPKGMCDVFIPTIRNEALIIEVKNGKKPIDVNAIVQVQRYVTSEGQRFAILSNGYEYLLLDFNIKPANNRKNKFGGYVVFWFDIFKARQKGFTELRYFKYLSFENLYRNESTQFFCDVAQYREWKYEQNLKDDSWNDYRCSLYQFFDFYAKKVPYKASYEIVGKKAYESLGMNVFNDFIKECKRNKGNSSSKTIKNNFSHIYGMLDEMKKHGKIGYISLSDSRKENLMEYEETELRKTPVVISTKDIQMILRHMTNKRKSIRDTVVVLLTISLGLERSQLLKLRWDDFDKGYKNILIKRRRIELPPILQTYLLKLHEENTRLKIKSPYIFQVYYQKEFRPMREWNINDIFDDLAQITHDSKWKDYSPQFVRNCLIRTLFFAGYSLEDIMYITGINIKNISKYISMDELLQRRSNKINWKPLFDGLLCESK